MKLKLPASVRSIVFGEELKKKHLKFQVKTKIIKKNRKSAVFKSASEKNRNVSKTNRTNVKFGQKTNLDRKFEFGPIYSGN